MIGYIILAAILLFVAVLLIRTLQFRPKQEPEAVNDVIALNEEKIINDLSAMIQCKTVSYFSEEKIDRTEFDRFVLLLEERFPLIHANGNLKKIGKTGLLYKIKGKSDKAPSVCMAHYDVVPANESDFVKPPFSGEISDGYVWGRGTLDTKGTLCALMESLEALLEQGYQPSNDLYLSFSGEEEISGDSCPDIVAYFEENKIRPAIVLDEGGAVVENTFPGVNKACALVGIAEKGSTYIDLTMSGHGGHASAPAVHCAIGDLAKAITAIEKHPFKAQLTKPVKEMFDTLGRYSTFGYRVLFANMWCFFPLLNLICKKQGGELNALLRTTCALTKMEGSSAYNVFPPKASVGMNLRLLGNDTVSTAVDYLNKVINNEDIKISIAYGCDPSIASDTSCNEWNMLCGVIKSTWPEAVVSPYLMLACSDSRHYCKISDHVYRFSAMKLSKEERGMIHGNDERVPIETMLRTVEFYTRLLKCL